MGIKNIHVLLIASASIVSLFFGFWGLNHDYALLGYAAIAAGLILIIYGYNFLKKVKAL